MGAEVDSLEIAVQTTADEANKSLDTLIKKIGLVAEGISALTKDSGLSDFAKKISELSKSGELAKGLTSLGNAKGAAKAGDNIAKSFADSIIKGYKIRDKEVQASIREMTQSLAKMSMGEIASGMDNPEFLNTFDKLGETVKKNAHIVSSQMGIFDDFYKYFQGLGKIDIPKNVIAELGDDWKKMRMTSLKSFSTDGSGIELDSIYQEMSDKFKGIFSWTADQTEQFREIISAVQAYRADIDKLEPVDPEKITGFEDGMWDDLYDGLKTMREKITTQMSGIAQDISRTAEEIRQQYADLGKNFTMSGSENQIERKINSLTNSLENAKLKQQELEASGNTGGKAYESTIASIVKYENQIESLKNQLKSLKQVEAETANVSANTTPSGHDPNVFSGTITGLGNDSEKDIESTRQSVKVAVSDMQYNAQAMAQTFGEAAQGIRDWARATAEYGMQAGKALNNPEVFQKLSGAGNEVKNLQDKLSDLVIPEIHTDSLDKLQKELQKTEDKLEETRTKLSNGITMGTVSESLDNSGYVKMQSEIALAEKKAEALRAKIEEVKSATKGMSFKNNAFSLLKIALANATTNAAKLARTLKSGILNGFSSLTKATRQHNNSLLKNLGTMARYAIGVRTLYSLVRKLRSAFVDGMNNLVQYSRETDASVSLLWNSMNQLKNSVAAAASPLLNALAPALNAIIQLCINAANAVNQLLSALTGHGTWIKATKQTKDYAKSLGGASKAADDLKTHTLGIDELNVVDQSKKGSSGGSGAGSGAADMFETKDIESKYKKLADEIKSYWDMGDFTELGASVGQWVKNGLDSIEWNGIQESARKIASSIGTFINGFVETEGLATSIGTTIGEAINTAVDFANTLLDVTHWDSIGKFIGDGLNGIVSTIQWDELGQMLAGGLNAVFEVAFNTGATIDFQKLGESLAASINNFFSNLDLKTAAEAINVWVQGIYDTFVTTISNVNWATVWDKAKEFLGNIDLKTVEIVIGAIAIKSILSVKFASAALGWIGKEISKKIAEAIASCLGLELAENAGIGAALSAAGGSIASTFVTGFKALLGSEAAASALAFINPFVLALTGIASTLAGLGLAVTSFIDMWNNGFSWIKEAIMAVGIALAAVGAVILGAPVLVAAVVAGIVAAVATIAVAMHDNWDQIVAVWNKAATWFDSNVVTPIVEFFRGLWQNVFSFFSQLWDGIVAIWQSVSEWFQNTVITPVSTAFDTACQFIGTLFSTLWTIISTLWSTVSEWFNSVVVTPIVTFFTGLKEKVETLFKTLWDGIKKIWSVVSRWFNTTVIMPVTTLFSTFHDTALNLFTILWSGIQTVWNTVSTWFQNTVITPVSTAFDIACTNIKSFFDNLWTGIKNGVIGAMNAVISTVESAVNGLIDILNTLHWDIPDWVPGIGGESFGFDISPVNIPRISMYAAGGFPEDGLFFANHNEMVGQFSNGKTAVANNEQIVAGITAGVREAVADVLAPYLSQIAENTRETADKDTSISLDGRELVSAINSRISRNGFSFT